MSWDIFIQDLPDVASAKDIPVDFRPKPLGEREAVVDRILRAIPNGELQDTDWIFVNSHDIDLSIQLHMEDAEQVRYLVAHVHGGAQSAACIAALLNALGLRALDTNTGEFFDGATLDESL
ncbi:MAG: hypothetical protein IPK99_04700 [Flavobacteriales bacterium]|nr:hypothetical protein [Flavobacteriales bacterium]